MKLRRRDGDFPASKLRGFCNFGYGLAFEEGRMESIFGTTPTWPAYTLPELRAAWGAYKDEFYRRRVRRSPEVAHWPKCWAELVFEDGMDPDEAREIVRKRREVEL